jgi:hypothetical protein
VALVERPKRALIAGSPIMQAARHTYTSLQPKWYTSGNVLAEKFIPLILI